VQTGDTLGDIAFRFGTTAAVLADINQLENPDLLQVGDVLILPGGEPQEDEDEETAADGEEAGEDEASGDGSEEEDEAGEEDDGEDATDETTDEEAAATPAPVTVTGVSPGGIPQPGSDVTLDDIPARPTALADFATTALPWFQDRTQVDEVEALFIDWAMPVLPRGDRFHLVDTDADGLFSLVAIFTDPGQPQHGSLTDANLAIYDPVPGQPTRWRQAFDHNLAFGGGQDFFVMNVVDMTGDGRRDVMYGETACGAHTCTTIVRLLVRDGDGYRDIAANVAVPTATSFAFDDVTGDGVPDLTIEGGTFGSVGAGPPRPFHFFYSVVGGAFAEIARVGLPTTVLVWIIADGNAAFDAGDYVGALTLYGQAASDTSLEEFAPGAGPELMALAALRAAITQLQLGDATAATSLAQAAAPVGGLIGAMATAYLSAIIANADAAAGCAALNGVLAPRAAEWDAFWEQFGYGLPEFRSEQICPF
jgi:LysM repeat protein